MNKAQLVDVVQKELGKEISKAAAERALNAVLGAIERGLKTGEQIQIKASKTVRFSAGQGLKGSL